MSDFTWIIFFIAFFLAMHILVATNSSGDRLWFVAYVYLLLSVFIFLMLPNIKGYFAYASADTLIHIGISRDIISSGHFAANNYYPITHSLLAITSLISMVDLNYLNAFYASLLYVFFVTMSYLISTVVFKKKEIQMWCLITSLPLLYGTVQTMIYPHFYSIYLLSLFFYLFFKYTNEHKLVWGILFLLLLIMNPFLYPITSIMIIVYLIIYWAILKLVNTQSENYHTSGKYILISIVAFISWISTFTIFGVSIRNVMTGLEPDPVQVTNAAETLSHFAPTDIIFLALKLYGDNIAYVLFSAISCYVIIKESIKRNKINDDLFIAVFFAVSIPAMIAVFFSTTSQTVARLINSGYYLIFTPLLVGYFFNNLNGGEDHNGLKTRQHIKIGSIILIFIIILVSFGGVFHSSYMLHPSLQITHEDVSGMQWFLSNKNESTLFIPMGLSFRLPDALYGIDNSFDISSSITYANEKKYLPKHFGYVNNSTPSEYQNSSENIHIIINRLFIKNNQNNVLMEKGVYFPPIFWRGYNAADFDELNEDHNIDRIYDNIGFFVYTIRPKNTK